jgi:hypothetical protein
MNTSAAKLAAGAACVLALAGCSASVTTGEATTVGRSDLEKQLSGMYTPDDPDATVDASCQGDLDAKVDATQDCHLTVGDQDADVRVTVTAVDGSDTKFDAVPFIPAGGVAAAVEKSLTDKGYRVDSLACEDELTGKEGETVVCTAIEPGGKHDIKVSVTKVDGLLVNFSYKVLN